MKFSIATAFFFSFILMCSCKNDEPASEETVDIVGFWEGTCTSEFQGKMEPQYYNLLIKSDGTLTNEGAWFSEIRINIGTWELNGNQLKFHVSNIYGGEMPNPQIGTATFDSQGRIENGMLQNLSGSSVARFELVKLK